MEDKYVGIKKSTMESPSSNLGLIWSKGEDGKWYCDKRPGIALESWQIEGDVKAGYLKLYEETKEIV